MSAESDGRVVLQLVSVLRVEAPSNRRAAIIERSQPLGGGVYVVGDLLIGGSKVLKSGLIDRGSEYRRFGDLHGLMLRLQMVPARDQIEVSDAGILNIGVQGRVADSQRVVVVDLIVDARGDRKAALWNREHVSEVRDAERLRVERERVDDCSVVDRIPPHIERKRRALIERAAQVPAVFFQQEGRFLRGVGIARVPEIVGEVIKQRAAKLVSAGLGEDFDAAEPEFVVLRGERILIDADLANGILRRKFAAAEPIDEDRTAAGSG